MLKLLGALLTVLACGGLGIQVARQYARRPQELRALQSSLQLLEAEITYGAETLPAAFRRLAELLGQPVRDLFAGSAAALEERRAYAAPEAWRMSLQNYRSRSALRPCDLQVLEHLGSGLGNSGREEQVKNLALARQQLYQLELAAEADRQRNEHVWRTLGFLAGLTLVLLLY